MTKLSGALLSSVLAASTCATRAQTGAPDTGTDAAIEEIVVTGTRSGTPLDQLALSVSVVDQQALVEQLRFDTNIGRALEFTVPGVSIQQDSRSSCGAKIRGRTPSFMVNGIPVNDDLRRGSCNGAFLLSPFAIQRIEAVRGGTALYGAGAPGGIVNLITRTPSGADLVVDLTAQSSFNTSDVGDSLVNDLYAGAGQDSDQISHYTGLGFRTSDIARTPDGDLVPGSEFDAFNLNSTIGIDFGAAGQLDFSGTFYREELGRTATADGSQVAGETFGEVVLVTDNPDRDNAFDQQLTLGATYTGKDLLLHDVAITLYYQDTRIQQRDNFYDINFGGDFFFNSNTDNERIGFRSALVRDYSLADTLLTTSYGFDYAHNSFYRPIVDPAAGGAITGFIAPETVLNTYALFGQAELDYGRLNFNAGVRQEWYRGEIGSRGFDPSIVNAGTPGDFKSTDLALFNAGVVYEVTAVTEVFFGFSQGAEISQIGRAARGLSDPSNLSPEPAASDQFELGIRGGAQRLTYEGAVFYSESDDAALLQVDPACAGQQICTLIPLRAPQEIYGIEGLLNWAATDTLAATAVLTVQRGEIFDQDGSNGVALASDDVVPLRLTVGTDWRPLAGLALGMQATYYGEGDFFSDAEVAEGNINTESQLLLNANANYALGRGELYLAASNLLNDEFVNVAQQAGGDYSYYLSEGRRITLGYRTQF